MTGAMNHCDQQDHGPQRHQAAFDFQNPKRGVERSRECWEQEYSHNAFSPSCIQRTPCGAVGNSDPRTVGLYALTIFRALSAEKWWKSGPSEPAPSEVEGAAYKSSQLLGFSPGEMACDTEAPSTALRQALSAAPQKRWTTAYTAAKAWSNSSFSTTALTVLGNLAACVRNFCKRTLGRPG
jgi:hypothetical protein